MAFEKNRVRAAVLALPLAVGLSLGAATAAQATTPEEDDRATAYDGNAKTCADADLGGTRIVQVDGENDYGTDLLEIEGGELNVDRYLDITAVDEGVTVTGIVVKGGDGYNVYVPGEKGLGETPPWENLRAPLNDGGNVPQLSHWYVCGSYTPPSTPTTTTTTTTETSETTTTTTEETSTTTPETTTSTSEETSITETSAETTTASESTTTTVAATSETEAPGVDNKSDSDDLAVTGFGSSWLIWAGVLFVLGGAATIAGVRVLRRQ